MNHRPESNPKPPPEIPELQSQPRPEIRAGFVFSETPQKTQTTGNPKTNPARKPPGNKPCPKIRRGFSFPPEKQQQPGKRELRGLLKLPQSLPKSFAEVLCRSPLPKSLRLPAGIGHKNQHDHPKTNSTNHPGTQSRNFNRNFGRRITPPLCPAPLPRLRFAPRAQTGAIPQI